MKTSTKWLLALLILVPAALFGYAQISQADWEVGELREDGLRIVPSGRSAAYRMIEEKGITDPGRIQLAVDEVWAPEGTRLWKPPEGA